MLLVAGNKYTATAFARTLEWRYPPLPEGSTGDVIVVLGGGTEPHIAPRSMVEVNAAADRVLYGIKLYQQEAAPVILLSGGDIDFINDSPSTPADDMATLMEMLGIPRADMIIQNQSLNTQQDAEFSCEIIKDQWLRTGHPGDLGFPHAQIGRAVRGAGLPGHSGAGGLQHHRRRLGKPHPPHDPGIHS